MALLDLPGPLTEGKLRWKIDQELPGVFGVKYTDRIPAVVQQDLSGAGAVSLLTYHTAWTTTGAEAGTLADGFNVGQLKKITLIVDGGDGTLTFNTDATIVFADAGDYALLVWDGADWIPVELGNDADGATAPVYSAAS